MEHCAIFIHQKRWQKLWLQLHLGNTFAVVLQTCGFLLQHRPPTGGGCVSESK